MSWKEIVKRNSGMMEETGGFSCIVLYKMETVLEKDEDISVVKVSNLLHFI
jgi:hypothetical protein